MVPGLSVCSSGPGDLGKKAREIGLSGKEAASIILTLANLGAQGRPPQNML